MTKMVSLCFPYGSPITCVCDPRGHVYNCFPTDTKGKMGSFHAPADPRRVSDGGLAARTGRTGAGGEDQRTEIVLATTALVAVVALFLSFLIYRLEKYLVSNGFQLPLFHQCNKDRMSRVFKQISSTSAQTDPVIYCYTHSQTVVGITHLSSLPAPAPSTSNVYPALPQRRFSYSPDSAVAESAVCPSMSSTLPLPRSRSQSSPYEVDSRDQVSTPIELADLHYMDSRASQDFSNHDSTEEREKNFQQPQDEEEVDLSSLYNTDCSSQQPLLDFMKLAEMEHSAQ